MAMNQELLCDSNLPWYDSNKLAAVLISVLVLYLILNFSFSCLKPGGQLNLNSYKNIF